MGRSRRGSLRCHVSRHLPRSVAILVLATLAFAVPVGAAPAPPAENVPPGPTGVVTVPNPGSESAGPKSSTPTTTSTTTPDGATTPTSTGAPAPTADLTPTAGPPELAKKGVVLPDDSLVAAMAELTLERARVDLIGQRRLTIDASMQLHDAKLTRVRSVRKLGTEHSQGCGQSGEERGPTAQPIQRQHLQRSRGSRGYTRRNYGSLCLRDAVRHV